MRPHDLAAAEGEAWAAAVLLHPHPDMGGDRFNVVVGEFFRALPAAGVTAVRFDFSSSDIETAAAETIEAIDLLAHEDQALPMFLVGYSFGGGIAATITDDRVAGWFLAAPALTVIEPAIGDDPRPKMVAAAGRDQFFPPDRLEAVANEWKATETTTIGGADHFFVGRTDALSASCLEWFRRVAR